MRPLPAKIFGVNAATAPMNQNVVNVLVIFLAICAILYFGQEIFIPTVLAILFSFLLSPLVRTLQNVSGPKPPAIVGAVFIAFMLMFGVVKGSQLSGRELCTHMSLT